MGVLYYMLCLPLCLLTYVPYIPACLFFLRAFRFFARLYFLRVLRAFIFLLPLHAFIILYVLRGIIVLCALRALIFLMLYLRYFFYVTSLL